MHVFFLHAPRDLGHPDLRHPHARIGHAVSQDLHSWEGLAFVGLVAAPDRGQRSPSSGSSAPSIPTTGRPATIEFISTAARKTGRSSLWIGRVADGTPSRRSPAWTSCMVIPRRAGAAGHTTWTPSEKQMFQIDPSDTNPVQVAPDPFPVHRPPEQLPRVPFQPLQVQLEAPYPVGPDLHRGEVSVPGERQLLEDGGIGRAPVELDPEQAHVAAFTLKR